MKKEKTYKWVKFTPDVIKKALGKLQKYTPIKKKGEYFLESLPLLYILALRGGLTMMKTNFLQITDLIL